jgi:hypothetical protein
MIIIAKSKVRGVIFDFTELLGGGKWTGISNGVMGKPFLTQSRILALPKDIGTMRLQVPGEFAKKTFKKYISQPTINEHEPNFGCIIFLRISIVQGK